jgi:hypothetical protein
LHSPTVQRVSNTNPTDSALGGELLTALSAGLIGSGF